MRSAARLGPYNAALVALYFAPVWGREAIKSLTSPFNGFEDRAMGTAAAFFRQLFDLNLDGLIRASSLLAGIKLVVAAGFVAYLIEFARALVVGREPNRETLDVVLILALVAVAAWAVPALAANDVGLVRLFATQFLLVAGAGIVIIVERQIDSASQAPSRVATVDREREVQQLAVTAALAAAHGTSTLPR